jgi:hypothetical protein
MKDLFHGQPIQLVFHFEGFPQPSAIRSLILTKAFGIGIQAPVFMIEQITLDVWYARIFEQDRIGDFQGSDHPVLETSADARREGVSSRLPAHRAFFFPVIDLVHLSPPLPVPPCLERLLHRVGELPPILGHRIAADLGDISIIVIPGVLEIGKQDPVAKIDGIIADVGFADPVQNAGKRVLVQDNVSLLVFSSEFYEAPESHAGGLVFLFMPFFFSPSSPQKKAYQGKAGESTTGG